MTKKSIIDMTDTSPGAVERLLNNDLAGPWAMIVMIRALAAERDRLREALLDIHCYPIVCNGMPVSHDSWISSVIGKARAALGE